MSIEVLYLPKKFIPPKQISGYAPGWKLSTLRQWTVNWSHLTNYVLQVSNYSEQSSPA